MSDNFQVLMFLWFFINFRSFRWSCINGDLAVAQWLHQTFGLTAEDAQSNYNEAFRLAKKYNHHDVVRWLQETFQLEK